MKINKIFILIIILLISCDRNSEIKNFQQNQHQFNNIQQIISNNINYNTPDSQKIILKRNLIKSRIFNQDNFFGEKISKNDFSKIHNFCKDNNILELKIGGNDLILFLINVDNGYLYSSWKYICYSKSDTYFNKMNDSLSDIEPINSNWYLLTFKTSLASD